MITAIVFDCYGVLYEEAFNRPVAEIITSLRPTYKVGMLSNSERSFLDRFLHENNAAHLFDVVLGSSETPFAKPQREIFEEMARRLDAAMSEILFIDDSPQNTAAAQAYGMQVITYINPTDLARHIKNLPGPSAPVG